MFRSTKPNVIENEEGVCVEVLGRVGMRYTEAGRTIDVDSEVLATQGIAVYAESIRNWSDGSAVDETTRSRVIHNIREAVRSQGDSIVVI